MLETENEEVVCLELREKFLKFVLPSIASMWAFSLYTMVDGVFVARGVGETAMAAVNLSAPFTSLVFMVGILLATGTSTIISIALGRGELEEFCLLDSDCQAMMKGANRHEKEYLVRVTKEITAEFLEKLAGGVYLEELDITTRECRVEQVSRFTFRMVLTQGVNRQIKRMCRAYDYHVRALKRVRVMHVTLGNLKPGEYRELGREDVERLCRDCGL